MTSDLFFGYADAAFGPISSSTPSYWKGNEIIMDIILMELLHY